MSGKKKKTKVALVFTGAVSLGSFEAGVAYELVRHVREQEGSGMEIDVIVGTSAGALTGAVTALSLAFGSDPALIEEAWLSVRLEDLLRLNPGDKSLLSSSKVEELISSYISPSAAGAGPGMAGLGSPAKTVQLVVVVTNLDGVKYRIHRGGQEDFSIGAIGYEDSFRFEIGPGFSGWERLGCAVRASSAYPAAFEHKAITRAGREYVRHRDENFYGLAQKEFRYSDGGIVNNQPLNRAIEVVSELADDGQNGDYDRVFLVVDPAPPAAAPVTGGDYGVFDVVGRAVWTIPRNQTLYKDLLLLEKVNRRLNWKNSFISQMAGVWKNHRIPPDRAGALDRLCWEVAGFKGGRLSGVEPAVYLKGEMQRISNAYRSEIRGMADPAFFVKYCFLLEQVADLRNKREITVEMIKPTDPQKELAGVIFGNFGGFLDAGFMKHDFKVGQSYARRWLQKEHDMFRVIHFRHEDMKPKISRRMVQMLFDNSVPLLLEEIGPKLVTVNKEMPRDVRGVLGILRMLVTSLAKYAGRSSAAWAREKIFSAAPPKKNKPHV